MNRMIKNYLCIALFFTASFSNSSPLISTLITGLSRTLAYTTLLVAPTIEKLISSVVTPFTTLANCSYPRRNALHFSTHELNKEMQEKIKRRLKSSKSDALWPKDQLGFCHETTILHADNKHNVTEVNYCLTDAGLEQTFNFPEHPFMPEATEDDVIDLYCAYIERENNEPINVNQKSRKEKLRSHNPYGNFYCEALYKDPVSYYNLCMRYKDRIFKNIPSLPALSALPLYCLDKKISAKICSSTLSALAYSPIRILGATIAGLGLLAIQSLGAQKIKLHHEETKDSYLPDNRIPLFKKHLEDALQKHEKDKEEHRFFENENYKLPTFAHLAPYNALISTMQKSSLQRRIAQLQTRESKLLNSSEKSITASMPTN